jgi:hypothetical protein
MTSIAIRDGYRVMNQNSLFEGTAIIPAVASLEVCNLGIITFATMQFPHRVTLISTQRALGATTLVRAIATIGGCSVPHHLRKSPGQSQARITVKWSRQEMPIEPVSPATDPELPSSLRVGQWTLVQLAQALQQAERDQCLALDREVFDIWDLAALAEGFRLIESSSCQIIAFLSPVALSSLSIRIRKLVRHELVEDPAHQDRSTIIPFTAS